MQYTLSVVFIFLCISLFGQKHPRSNKLPDISLATGLQIYNHEHGDGYLLRVYPSNKFEEKTFLYFGTIKSQHKNDYWQKVNLNAKFDEVPAPSIMVQIAKNTFLDETEIANIYYQEFIDIITIDSGKNVAESYYPDLSTKQYESYYLNPEFYFYPVIGIDYRKAKTYCLWRSRTLNYKIAQAHGELNSNNERDIIMSGGTLSFNGRLPLEKEWLKYAKHAFEEMDTIAVVVDKKISSFIKNDLESSSFVNHDFKIGQPLTFLTSNMKMDNSIHFEIPLYLYSFKPTKSSFFHLLGNVMEVTEEGYLKGGSHNTLFDSNILERRFTDVASSEIGFRCACDVYKKN